MSKGKRRRGSQKPTKLTPELSKRIEDALRLGSFRKTAALYAGIGYRTFQEWMQWGKERPRSEYGVFRAMVIETETHAEVLVGGVLLGAASKNPKWAVAWLKLRHRKRWAPPEKVEVTGKDGGALEVRSSLEQLTDEQLAQIDAIMSAAAAAQRSAKGAGEEEP